MSFLPLGGRWHSCRMLFGYCVFKECAESIYLALVKCIKDKNLQVGNIVGMGFDDAATFSRRLVFKQD